MAIQELLEIMEQLDDAHKQLLELAERKRRVLIQNEVDELNRIVNQEGKLSRQIAEWESKRLEAIGNYLIKRGFRPDPRVTVTDLIKMMFKAEEKQALQQAQKSLLDTLLRLKDMHALNQQLIEQSLAYINHSYDVLLGPPEDEVVYHNPSQQQGAQKRPGMFDTRA
ncbi:flagellar protein FlgN [Gorillibacterium sp. sgz5001074]|uniref:flagellar protein FlgN n=1 Tax=Gorillibacterium sp. sgz5001074 TaxID=3446695 RepID=UPI003F6778BB